MVLAIMGLLLAMVMPQMIGRYQLQQLEQTAYQLHSDLRWAQELAENTDDSVQVLFWLTGRKGYAIRGVQARQTYKKVYIPSCLDTWEGQTLEFYADRRASKNGHITLGYKGEKRYVYYYQTGRLRISHQ